MFMPDSSSNSSAEPSTDLYRTEALQHASERTLGSTMITQPFSTRSLTALLTFVTILSLALLWQGQYARKETVQGYLRPDAGISRIYPRNRGIAESVYVGEGQLVQKGAPLISIRGSYALANGQAASSTILAELLEQEERLTLQVEREKEKSILNQKWRKENLDSLKDEIAQLERIHRLQGARTAVSAQQLKASHDLRRKGYLSTTQWLSSKTNHLAEQKELVQINQRLTRTRAALKNAVHQQKLSPVLLQDTLAIINRDISIINQKTTEQEERSSHLITAPVTGRVTALNISVGDSVSASRPLLSILPEDATLYAWLFIPSRAAGLTEDGQRVRLMYDSFPYQQFGTHPGKIISISDAVISPGDISGPLRLSEPAFIAKVAIDSATITAYGQERSLQTDMLVTADIVQAKRSILEWMLNPLLALRGRTW